MTISNVHDAKTNLSKLIEAALRGEEVIIAKAGKPVVRLVAIEEAPLTGGEKLKRGFGAMVGKWTAPADEEWAESDRYISQLF
ncbi:MAG TPA: type II toxin-antitoxin system prevent-host-death family antitoxin [Beijerinckia sp.]|jgi:prevent-host-death family protein|nr:type II toxin-antitoxin system prevent-host-death family antitoxin [Beijerinckia sp.]